jgi:hypothetical protein
MDRIYVNGVLIYESDHDWHIDDISPCGYYTIEEEQIDEP